MDKKVLRWNYVFQYGYVITNIVNALILLPFYLKKIDPSTLGIWLATGNILAWMTLIDPGIGEILQQKIAEYKGKGLREPIEKTIGSGLIASGIILLLAIVAGLIFYSLIGVIINKDVSKYHHLQVALLLSIVSTGMSLTSFSMSGINQGLHNAPQVAISSILANVLFLATNITLLLLGFDIISIAFANLCRALFINIYNYVALKTALNRDGMRIVFEGAHFRNFIKIFSFTSLASIVGGLSASMDTIFLARFIPPSMITIFEINKRPVQLTQSLVGRHSVAMMPSISHALGTGDKESIISLINTHFRYYVYAALFIAVIFCFNYHDLIAAWMGPGKYAGNMVIYLLVGNFLFGLMGYYMANMCYALGDIKINSLVYILKGIFVGGAYYFAARSAGIPGVLTIMLSASILIDFCFFSYRLFKLGFLDLSLIGGTLKAWVIIIPVSCLAGMGLAMLTNPFIGPDQHVIKLLVNGSSLALVFICSVFLFDGTLRSDILALYKKITAKFGIPRGDDIYHTYPVSKK